MTDFKKKIFVPTLCAALIMVSSCAPKKETSKSSSANISNVSSMSEEETVAPAPTKFEKEDITYSMQTVVSESVLPDVPVSIYDAFVQEHVQNDGNEYYKEFKEFNVPMEMTPRVTAYIKYFTERIPNVTQRWLDRANKYMYIVQDIFIKEGLPSDLIVLGFTESGFNTHAISHAGAGGMWQFIPSTGKLYGMENNFWVDERRDFEKATYAAAKYLKSLHAQFGDWYLALAAYNAGPGKIYRATKKHKTTDFFKISSNRYTLKLETRDYVPKFLAQLIIYENYLRYGFKHPEGQPLLYDKIALPSQTNTMWLSKQLGINHEQLTELNPELKLPMTPPKDNYELRVPYGTGETALAFVNSASVAQRKQFHIHNAQVGETLASIATRYGSNESELKAANGLTMGKILAARPIFIPLNDTDSDIVASFSAQLAKLAQKYYKVKRGDTFIAIAHKHNMRQYELEKLNPNVRAAKIYPGQVLAISEGSASAVKSVTIKKKTTNYNKSAVSQYKVKKGDSLWSIAQRFGTTVNKLKVANNMTNEMIMPGKTLRIK